MKKRRAFVRLYGALIATRSPSHIPDLASSKKLLYNALYLQKCLWHRHFFKHEIKGLLRRAERPSRK